jgi:hypothetical protein
MGSLYHSSYHPARSFFTHDAFTLFLAEMAFQDFITMFTLSSYSTFIALVNWIQALDFSSPSV